MGKKGKKGKKKGKKKNVSQKNVSQKKKKTKSADPYEAAYASWDEVGKKSREEREKLLETLTTDRVKELKCGDLYEKAVAKHQNALLYFKRDRQDVLNLGLMAEESLTKGKMSQEDYDRYLDVVKPTELAKLEYLNTEVKKLEIKILSLNEILKIYKSKYDVYPSHHIRELKSHGLFDIYEKLAAAVEEKCDDGSLPGDAPSDGGGAGGGGDLSPLQQKYAKEHPKRKVVPPDSILKFLYGARAKGPREDMEDPLITVAGISIPASAAQSYRKWTSILAE